MQLNCLLQGGLFKKMKISGTDSANRDLLRNIKQTIFFKSTSFEFFFKFIVRVFQIQKCLFCLFLE
jgi:hypothetical protein